MWKTVKLGDVCKIVNGSTPSRKESRYWTGGNIFWFTIDDMRQQGRDIVSTCQKITDTAIKETSVRLIPANSVLLCCTASIGEVAIARAEMASNQQFNALIPNDGTLLTEYLYYVASTLKKKLLSVSGSTTINFISIGKLKEIEIPLPPLAEQQKIVEKLDKAFAEIDRAIEATEDGIRMSSELYASAVKLIYFSDNDAPVVHLKDVAKIKGGKRIPKGKKLTNEITDYPYIRVSDFKEDGTVDIDSLQYITADIRDQISNYTISTDDVYVSIAGTIGKTGVIPSSLNGANLTENAAKIVLDRKCLRDYFYFFTTSASFKEQAIRHTRTAAQPKLALERLGKIKFPLHEIENQKSIIDKVKEIRNLVTEHKESMRLKAHTLRTLKSAILAQELKGLE